MDIKKTVILGTFGPERTQKIGNYQSPLNVRVTIEYERDHLNPSHVEPRLSISGEVYRVGARDYESCGQILGEVRALLGDAGARLNKSRDEIARLLGVWERWHLNDMRAGCEHQRASWNPLEEIQLVTYRLTGETLATIRAMEHNAVKLLENGETVTWTRAERTLASLPYEVKRGAEDPAPGAEYKESQRETKTAGWVRPDEHPRGLLCKPCPVCGYKYGSAWLYETVPDDVVKFLEDI